MYSLLFVNVGSGIRVMSKSSWWNRNARNGEDFAFKLEQSVKKKLKQNARKIITTVYRYFDNEDHAAAFARGEVFISTLKRCREYENPLQGDHEEGFERYNTGRTITGNGSDPAFVAMAARAGIRIGPSSGSVTLTNNQRVSRLHDAYVLCTTMGAFCGDRLEAFGKYCVKINDVGKFHSKLTKSLALVSNISETARGEIIYRERSYKEFEDSPGLIGFVKPSDKYSNQKEYRFLWYVPVGVNISGLVISCPDISRIVTRIA